MNDKTILNELADKNIKRYWLLNKSAQSSAMKLIGADNTRLLFNAVKKSKPF